jgi:hypothetical protein
MVDLPSYVWALVLLGVVGIPAVTTLALNRGALAAGLDRRIAATVSIVAAGVWGLWIAAAYELAASDLYRAESGAVNLWIGVVVAAVLAVTLLATRIPVVARILADPATPRRLAWPHTLRVAGVVFLLVMAMGKLPAVFAVPAGVGDIAVGVAAVIVARRGAWRRRSAVWFNILGIVDLTVAVGIGFLAGLGPRPVLDVTPSTDILAELPLVLIPTTAVPLAVALHIVSLRRLVVAARREPVTPHLAASSLR